MLETSTYEILNIIIDEELKNLLPELSKNTFKLLEESLLEHGCLHPLTLWGNILIDGHNRYEIAKKHSIPITAVSKEFNSRDEVIIWIITTQVSRRNLNAKQLSYYRGLHYKMEKRSNGDSARFAQRRPVDQNDPLQESTAKRLASYYNVSAPTIKRDEKFADALIAIGENSLEAQRNILSGATDITRKHLRELLAGEETDILDTAKKIEEGTFVKPRPSRPETSNFNAPYTSDAFYPPDAGLRRIHSLIINTADHFANAMRNQMNNGDASDLKTTLRTHIEVLESLYGQL